jgi:hypothetical protein
MEINPPCQCADVLSTGIPNVSVFKAGTERTSMMAGAPKGC